VDISRFSTVVGSWARARHALRALPIACVLALTILVPGAGALAQTGSQPRPVALPAPVEVQHAAARHAGGEANLVLPDLSSHDITFLGLTGHTLLLGGLLVCVLGLAFGGMIYSQLKNMPVHQSMRDVS